MDHPLALKSTRDYWPSIALFALAIFWPIAWLTWDWATLTGYYEESLGYRYFYSLRTVHEPQVLLFFPQGNIVTFCHELIQVGLDQFLPLDQLSPRIDIFARVAIALAHGVVLAAFAWALRPPLFDGLRIPLAGLWALLYYVDSWDGYYVLLSPDYHAWIPATGLLLMGLMARAVEDGDSLPAARYWQLGLISAFGICVKPTLGILAAVAAGYFLMVDRPFYRARRRTIFSIFLAVLLALSILYLSYWGHFDHLRNYATNLAYFLVSAMPIDMASTQRVHGTLFGGRAFGLIAIVVLPLVMILLVKLAKSIETRALAGVLALGALLYVCIVVLRFTPVTFFEAGVFLVAAISLSSAAVLQWRWIRLVPAVAIALAMGLGTSIPHTLSAQIANLHGNDAAQARLRSVLASIPGQKAFLIPSNEFQFLSLEGALFKGTSDFSSHRGIEKTPLLHALLQDRDFLFGNPTRYQHNDKVFDTHTVLIFTVLYTGRAEFEGVAAIPKQIEYLERNYNTSMAAFACNDWVDFVGRIAVVCRRDSPPSKT